MNKENYELIYKSILPRYKETVEKLKYYKETKKDYDNTIQTFEEQVDNKRHEYLLVLMDRIKGLGNTIEAKLNLKKEVYHYSNREFDRKKLTGWIPFVGKTSYKQYWEKVRNDYLKKLDKK